MIDTALLAIPLMTAICDAASAAEVDVSAIIEHSPDGTKRVELKLHHRPSAATVRGAGDADGLSRSLAAALTRLTEAASSRSDADLWRGLMRDIYHLMRLV